MRKITLFVEIFFIKKFHKNFNEIFIENNFIFIVDENKIIFSLTRSVA